MRKKSKTAAIEESVERILNKNTDFDTAETYKTIRTNIMFSMPKTETGKAVVITSSNPGEGKTTAAINLAITFAQTGIKILLIDCDMRKPRVNRYLQLDSCDGISNILCGFTDFDKAVKKNIRPNLDVLTAGEIPPHPAELLQNAAFSALLDRLKKEYDYIFIDTPPVSIVTDAVIISKLSDGVIVVVRENETTFDVLDDTMDSIKHSSAKIIGVIALGCETKAQKYGYYKKGSYGYRYGYDYRYGDERKKESWK